MYFMKPGSFTIVLLLLLYLLLIAVHSYGQTILVRDIDSFRPVEDVAVFNPAHTSTTLTNGFGIADISVFLRNDTLIFQHASYETIFLLYADLEQKEFNVYLKKKSVALDEIIISATRFERELKDLPNRIVSVSAKKIEFDNPQTAADVLASTNEVFVQKSQLGGGSPMIRGFSANKVLIVLDGVRMNNAIFRSGNLQNVISIDPNAIENTEVIFGPGTVIYGSDALGGVMSFMTLEPRLSTESKFSSSVNLMGRYSFANKERTGHLDFRLAGKKWASVTSFSTSWFDDLRMGSSGPDEYLRRDYVETNGGLDQMVSNTEPEIQRFSGYSQLNVMQKFRFRPNERVDLNYGFHYSETSDVPRYDRLLQYSTPDTLKYASWYYGPQKWMLNVLNGSFMINCRMISELKISLAYQTFEESRHSRKFADPWFKNQDEHVDMYTANIDIEKRLNKNNILFYGFEGVFNDVKSTAFKRDYLSGDTEKTGTRYPDGKNHYTTYAAYLNYERRFSSTLIMFAGLRYNYVKLYSTFNDTSLYHFPFNEISINNGALNGSVGFSWRPADVWQLRINLSSGFRAPNLDDAGKVFDSSPGNVVVPNPGLKPEYAYSIEGGASRRLGGFAVIEASAFYTLLVDAMVRRNFEFNGRDSIPYDGELSQVEAIVNAAGAKIYGLSATALIDIGEFFKLKSSITWVRGEDDEGDALRHVSPVFGNTALIFNHAHFLAEIYANYNGSIPYSRLAPSERDKSYIYAYDNDGNPYSPSWWTLNIKASYRIIEQLTLDAGIENLFNKRYRPYSSGIAAPGRNFIVAVRAHF